MSSSKRARARTTTSTRARSTRSSCASCGRSASTASGRAPRAQYLFDERRQLAISTCSAASACSTSAATTRASAPRSSRRSSSRRRAPCSSASRRCPASSPRRCSRRTPPRLERVLFTSSGTEAVEAALKLGRAATGRTRVLSAEHGFHGLTLGALSRERRTTTSRRALRPAAAGLRPRSVRRPRRARAASCAREDVALFLVEPVQGQGRLPAACRLSRGRAGALPSLRHALLRRRGADRLRPHGQAVRVRALGARAGPRDRREVAFGRLRPGRRAADVAARSTTAVFDSLEHAVSHGSTFAPNDLAMAAGLATLRELDDAAARRARGAARRAAARAHAAARRALRRRARRARARADVGDRVRGAGVRQRRPGA